MCLNFFIIRIDCDNDNKIKIDTSVLVDVMNKLDQEFKNQAGSDTVSYNNLMVNNNGTFNCPGGFTVSQTNDTTTTTTNTFNSNQQSSISTNIVTQVKDELTQSQTEGILGFLDSIGQSGSVTNSQDITNKVRESLTNAVRQVNYNSLWTGTSDSNLLTLNNNGVIEGGQCNIYQSNIANVRITNIANSLQSSLQNDQFLNTLLDYSKQTTDTGTLGWLKWVILGVIVLVVLIIVGVLLYFAFSGSSTPKVARPEGEAEKLCILETEEQGARLPAGEKKALFQKCVIRKEEERFGGGERQEGGQRFGEGEGRFESSFGAFNPYRR